MIDIAPGVAIDPAEIRCTASRSGGPGGQNVNKVSTRVTLWFDVDGSPSLAESARARIRGKLAGRIGRDGLLQVSCGVHRTQAANRRGALERFVALLREALREEPPRVPTRVPSGERRRRVEAKRRRAAIKRLRSVRGEE